MARQERARREADGPERAAPAPTTRPPVVARRPVHALAPAASLPRLSPPSSVVALATSVAEALQRNTGRTSDRLPDPPGLDGRIRRASSEATNSPRGFDRREPQAGVHARPSPVIQRQVWTHKEKGKVSYYTDLDPNPLNMRMFKTSLEAEAYEKELLAARKVPAAAKVGTAAAATTKPATAVEPKAASPPPTKVVLGPAPAASKVSGATTVSPTAEKTATGAKTPAVATSAPAKPAGPTWEQRWRGKQSEVIAAMSPFVEQFKALDPTSSLRIRGSLASGFRKLHLAEKGYVDLESFNPTDFDIDAYVVSDTLFGSAAKGNVDAQARGQVPGSYDTEVNKIIREMRKALAKIEGNRDAKETFRFNVLLRTTANAGDFEQGDRDALWYMGYEGEQGYLDVPAPKAKK